MRASSSNNRTPLKSVASLHEDYCALKDCNSTGSGDSGALSGSTDNGTCGNEKCNRKSLKSINSINTRKPVIPDLNFPPTRKRKRACTETLILTASKLTRQMSKSRMKVVIDDDIHSPDRKVLSWLKALAHISLNPLFSFLFNHVQTLDDWHFPGELSELIIHILIDTHRKRRRSRCWKCPQ